MTSGGRLQLVCVYQTVRVRHPAPNKLPGSDEQEVGARFCLNPAAFLPVRGGQAHVVSRGLKRRDEVGGPGRTSHGGRLQRGPAAQAEEIAIHEPAVAQRATTNGVAASRSCPKLTWGNLGQEAGHPQLRHWVPGTQRATKTTTWANWGHASARRSCTKVYEDGHTDGQSQK